MNQSLCGMLLFGCNVEKSWSKRKGIVHAPSWHILCGLTRKLNCYKRGVRHCVAFTSCHQVVFTFARSINKWYISCVITGCPLRIRRRGGTATARSKPQCYRPEPPHGAELRQHQQDYSPSEVTDSSQEPHHSHQPSFAAVDRVIFPNCAFLQDESHPKVPKRRRSVLAALLKALPMVLLVILFVNPPSAGKLQFRLSKPSL